MTRPIRSSVPWPTRREVALMLFAVAGGVWLWSALVDRLHAKQDEAAGGESTLRDLDSPIGQMARSREYVERTYGKGLGWYGRGGAKWRRA